MSRHGLIVASLCCTLAAPCASAQTRSTSPDVSTVTAPRGIPRDGDTTYDLVFVVRDLYTPDRPRKESLVAVGKPGADLPQYSMQRHVTRADGTARFTGLGGMNIGVAVVMIGYDEVRFPLQVARACRQTVEVYMRPQNNVDLSFGGQPAQPRVVVTTCAPPYWYEPFGFALGGPRPGPRGEEIRDATVMPPGIRDSLPPAFQLELSSPAGAPDGAKTHAVIRPGSRRGMSYFLGMLGGAFGGPPSGSSFALKPFELVPADSMPLALSEVQRAADGSWTALATLPNGGRFELFIDARNRRGEFRSVAEADDDKVFRALAGLIDRRP